jgi:hypothetical protein
MRTLMITAAAAAMFAASPAMASATSQTQVDATLAPACNILSSSASITLGAKDEQKNGTFSYRCNFVGSPTITIKSDNGGVKYSGANGESLKDYGVYVNDTDASSVPSSWAQASSMTSGYDFTGISTSAPANTDITPFFHVGLSQDLDLAGTYNDVLTFTINP